MPQVWSPHHRLLLSLSTPFPSSNLSSPTTSTSFSPISPRSSSASPCRPFPRYFLYVIYPHATFFTLNIFYYHSHIKQYLNTLSLLIYTFINYSYDRLLPPPAQPHRTSLLPATLPPAAMRLAFYASSSLIQSSILSRTPVSSPPFLFSSHSFGYSSLLPSPSPFSSILRLHLHHHIILRPYYHPISSSPTLSPNLLLPIPSTPLLPVSLPLANTSTHPLLSSPIFYTKVLYRFRPLFTAFLPFPSPSRSSLTHHPSHRLPSLPAYSLKLINSSFFL